jgi:hypothetical protein
MMVIGAVYWIFAWVPFAGLKIIKPNEALVLTLFGKYYGSEGPRIFLCQPLLRGRESRGAGARSGSGRHGGGRGCGGDLGQRAGRHPQEGFRLRQEDIAEGHHPQQRQAEDQRPAGQSHRRGHCGHLAGCEHGQGGVQRGRLPRISLHPDGRRPAQHGAPVPLRRSGRRRR